MSRRFNELIGDLIVTLEKKEGHASITIEIEFDRPLLNVMEESISKMPDIMKILSKEEKKKFCPLELIPELELKCPF